MKEQQTPRKEISQRRSKELPSKLPSKIPKKSLNAAFSSVSEDALTESSVLESNDFSSISKSLIEASPNQSLSASSDSTPPCAISTVDDASFDVSQSEYHGTKIGSLEVDVLMNLLKQARFQVLSSNDVDVRSRKVMDALIEVSLKDLCELHEERDRIDMILSARVRIIFICCLLWFIFVLMMFFRSGSSSSYAHPPPT